MISKERYVIDTNSIIFYFEKVFKQPCALSKRAQNIISEGFNYNSNILLVIPSIVFVEIQNKWFKTEEFAKTFYYEVYMRISESENIEVKPIEQEVLSNLKHIRGILSNHDIHDKLILASAIMLNCPLISTDGKIEEFVKTTKIIPSIIN
ncbi:MAG: hypothetical protein WCZ90_02480 [Melioribacteraceae bacterium]